MPESIPVKLFSELFTRLVPYIGFTVRVVSTGVFCVRCPARNGAAAYCFPCFSRAITYMMASVIARGKQRKQEPRRHHKHLAPVNKSCGKRRDPMHAYVFGQNERYLLGFKINLEYGIQSYRENVSWKYIHRGHKLLAPGNKSCGKWRDPMHTF
jgi:hypothetical protein